MTFKKERNKITTYVYINTLDIQSSELTLFSTTYLDKSIQPNSEVSTHLKKFIRYYRQNKINFQKFEIILDTQHQYTNRDKMLKDLLKPQDILYIYDIYNFTNNITDVFNTLKSIFDKEVTIITIHSEQINTTKYRNTHKILSAYSELLPILNSVIKEYIHTPKEKKKNRIDIDLIKHDLIKYRKLNYTSITQILNSKNIKITDKTVKKYCKLLQIK